MPKELKEITQPNLNCLNHMIKLKVPRNYHKWFMTMSTTMENCKECGLDGVNYN